MTTIIVLCLMLAGMLLAGFVGFCWGFSACRAQVKAETLAARWKELKDFANLAAQQARGSRREQPTVQ